ncbi:MAG: hypothetical protein KDG50_15515 [Chromatiales bacterium]|nr:hypothetical protein [Chromatiales bacterium]
MGRGLIRNALSGLLAAFVSVSVADSPAIEIPGGGTVRLPSAYKPVLAGEFNHQDHISSLIAYRKYRSTMAGSWECDGMVAVSRSTQHGDLHAFMRQSGAALTTSWRYADLKPGWFGGQRENFPIERESVVDGEELRQELQVHLVGWLGTYDKPARMYAYEAGNGIRVAVWIFDADGGLKKARRIAREIAGSYSP